MEPPYTELPGNARLSFGADEFIFVELSEEMDLHTALRVQAIVAKFREVAPRGVIDIVPSHVSYMIRIEPDIIDARGVVNILMGLHSEIVDSPPGLITTRIIELPVLYDDPWSRETASRFRDRRASPEETDVEFVARANGFDNTDQLIAAHSKYPYIATFNNFVPGNAECVQLAPRRLQIEAPKYLRPRTHTPSRSLGLGGSQTTIYPTDCPGGFQLLGRCAVPVIDFTLTQSGFENSPILLTAPTVVKYDPVDRETYDHIRDLVHSKVYDLRQAKIEFDIAAFDADPAKYPSTLLKELG